MEITSRSYLTAGVAALGAAAIAVTPVQPLSTGLTMAPHRAGALAVELAASTTFDPFEPWQYLIDNTKPNILGLIAMAVETPFPVLRQFLSNQIGYLSLFPDIALIPKMVAANINNAIDSLTAADISTLDQLHKVLFAVLPNVTDIPQNVLDATTTTLSGTLAGLVGTLLAPVLAVRDSVTAIVDAVKAGDIVGVVNELLGIPAYTLNAFLNGGPEINIAPLLAPLLPAGSTLNEGYIKLGGLLSPNGSLLNSIGINADIKVAPLLPPVHYEPGGRQPGPIGSFMGLTDTIAQAINPGQGPAPSLRAAATVSDTPTSDTPTSDTPTSDTPTSDAPTSDAPAPKTPAAGKRSRSVVGSANSGNETAKRASSRGMTRSSAARSAR